MKKIKKFYENYWNYRLSKENISETTINRAKIISYLFESENLGKTLDVGCGDGTLLYVLSQKYKFIIDKYGIEISYKACQKALEKGINVIRGNAEILPFPDNFFDTVICSEVLEHLVFPEKALEEIYRVSKNNAIIIFSIPNLGYFKYRLKLLIGKSPFEQGRYSASEHLHFWTRESFEKFLQKHGFKILMVRGGIGPKIGMLSYIYPSLLSDTLYIKTLKI